MSEFQVALPAGTEVCLNLYHDIKLYYLPCWNSPSLQDGKTGKVDGKHHSSPPLRYLQATNDKFNNVPINYSLKINSPTRKRCITLAEFQLYYMHRSFRTHGKNLFCATGSILKTMGALNVTVIDSRKLILLWFFFHPVAWESLFLY